MGSPWAKNALTCWQMRYIRIDRISGENMSRYSLCVTATALLLCAGPLHAQLVTNGTLDTDASGWTLADGTGCNNVGWDGTLGNPPGAIRLNACGESDSDPTAAQTINGLVIGNTYLIKVDVQLFANSSGGGTGRSFGIFLNNEPGSPLLLTEFLDGSWHTVTTTFTAASTSATIIFAAELDARTPGGPGQSTDVAYAIDNISMVSLNGGSARPAPVPTTSELALLVLGMLLAACAALALRRCHAARRKSIR
jgi:hypothetical protein